MVPSTPATRFVAGALPQINGWLFKHDLAGVHHATPWVQFLAARARPGDPTAHLRAAWIRVRWVEVTTSLLSGAFCCRAWSSKTNARTIALSLKVTWLE